MSLDQAIKSGKEHRKPYRRSQAFDITCRNHGGCPYCSEGRLHKRTLAEIEADEAVEEGAEDFFTEGAQ